MTSDAKIRQSRSAFTLIEVLAAIALLVVLMVAIFPGLRAAQINSLRHKAASEALEIAGAALAYRHVYGTWPCQDDEDVARRAPDAIITAGATTQSHEGIVGGYSRDIGRIVDVLSCGDGADLGRYNPRSIVFLELPESCFPKIHGKRTAYPCDPWGHPYVMMMTLDRGDTVSRTEGGIRAAIPENSYGITGIIETTDDVAVFSWGDPTSATNGTSRLIGSWNTR